ncbi:MAG: Maf family protein [Coprobacillus sp.]
MNKIILASNSPRRKELLEKAGIDFIIDASSIDETMDETLPLIERFQKLATDKATPIHEKYPNDIVIGADTIVYFDNQIIGKAKDRKEAKRILTTLSHHKHSVYTGVAIYFQNELVTFVEKTDVYFKDITDLLDDYLDSLEWQGKAGAYGIQGKAVVFVDKIDGDRDNVIGLPITRVVEVLENRKVL